MATSHVSIKNSCYNHTYACYKHSTFPCMIVHEVIHYTFSLSLKPAILDQQTTKYKFSVQPFPSLLPKNHTVPKIQTSRVQISPTYFPTTIPTSKTASHSLIAVTPKRDEYAPLTTRSALKQHYASARSLFPKKPSSRSPAPTHPAKCPTISREIKIRPRRSWQRVKESTLRFYEVFWQRARRAPPQFLQRASLRIPHAPTPGGGSIHRPLTKHIHF